MRFGDVEGPHYINNRYFKMMEMWIFPHNFKVEI